MDTLVETTAKLQNFKDTWHLHKNDPQWLSVALIEIAVLLITRAEEMAIAEMEEADKLISLVEDSALSGEKKMAIAEAERRVLIKTGNKYGILKAQQEMWVEVLNGIKRRLDVLGWDFKNTKI